MKKYFKAARAAMFVYFLACSPSFLLSNSPSSPLSFAPAAVYAAVPNAVNYQGRYREYGQPVTGPRSVNFVIWSDQIAGAQLWSSGWMPINVSSGIFYVVLNPVFNTVNGDLRTQNLWLETSVGSAGGSGSTPPSSYGTLTPREQLTANWYSLHALSAEGISASSGQEIDFIQGSSSPMVITNNGYVVVGVDPTTASQVATKHYVDSVTGGGVGTPGSAGQTLRSNGSNWVSNNVLYNDGTNVGISSTTPTSALTVNGRIKDETGFVMPVGTILPYVGAAAPQGWLLCNGQAVSRSICSDLFNLIQITYGSGDGVTTFNVPNLQGRFPMGETGATNFGLGNTGGSAIIAANQLPAHTHDGITGNESADHYHTGSTDSGTGGHSHSYSIYADPINTNSVDPNATNYGAWRGQTTASTSATDGATDGQHSHTFTTGGSLTTGGVAAHHTHYFSTDGDNGISGVFAPQPRGQAYYQPYIALNYIIKY